MDGERICGLPEELTLGIGVRRSPAALWRLESDLSAIGHDQLRATIQEAFDAWTAVAGCSGREAGPGEQPDLTITVVTMDGPQGVLADCQLPGPPVQHLRLDGSERWIVQAGRGVPQGRIDLGRVLCHELGHFWGSGHIDPGNLMAPIYSDSIDRPQQGDVQELTGRYGPPSRVPPPPPSGPDLPVEMRIIGQSGNVTARYKLVRLD